MKLTVVYRNFANAPKSYMFRLYETAIIRLQVLEIQKGIRIVFGYNYMISWLELYDIDFIFMKREA
jgi:hypothetical protein